MLKVNFVQSDRYTLECLLCWLNFKSQRQPVSYSQHAQIHSDISVDLLINLVNRLCVHVILSWVDNLPTPQNLKDEVEE